MPQSSDVEELNEQAAQTNAQPSTPLGGGLLARSAEVAQQQLAGQTLAPVGPTHIVINGVLVRENSTFTTELPGRVLSPERR